LPEGVPKADNSLANFITLLRTICFTLDEIFLWKLCVRRAVRLCAGTLDQISS
jgi:hypothetical protein